MFADGYGQEIGIVHYDSEPQTGESYRVIADNRPWLGAIVTEQPPQSPNGSRAQYMM